MSPETYVDWVEFFFFNFGRTVPLRHIIGGGEEGRRREVWRESAAAFEQKWFHIMSYSLSPMAFNICTARRLNATYARVIRACGRSAAIAVRHLNGDPEIAGPTQYPPTPPEHIPHGGPTSRLSFPNRRPGGEHFTHHLSAPAQVLDMPRKNSHGTKTFSPHLASPPPPTISRSLSPAFTHSHTRRGREGDQNHTSHAHPSPQLQPRRYAPQ